jgi:hypothetical protein
MCLEGGRPELISEVLNTEIDISILVMLVRTSVKLYFSQQIKFSFCHNGANFEEQNKN